MSISYNRLFKLLIDRRLKNGELCRMAGISHPTLTKMSRNESVGSDIVAKICNALNVEPNDVMEIVKEEK